MDRAFAGGAEGIWRTGAGGSWKRVRLNKKTSHISQGKCMYVSMYVKVGFDMVRCKRMGRDSQGDGNGSMLKTWVTDLARDVVMSYRVSEVTRGSETLIMMIGLPSVLHQILW